MRLTNIQVIAFRMAAVLVITLTSALGIVRPASAQDDQFADRPVSEIRIRGLQRTSEQEVRNNIRTAVGDPFDADVIRADERRLNRLNRFRFIDVLAELQPDGSVVVLFDVEEQAIIREVQVAGNTVVTDQELIGLTRLRRDLPRDDFQIQRAVRSIESFYRERGHYLASVSVDETELAETGVLIFRVLEGPRVRVRELAFEGNKAFGPKQLKREIDTRTAVFILNRGVIDEERLVEDVAALDRFYKDRGYLDVRVDRTVELSPDSREARVTFIIDEGRQYTLGNVVTQSVLGGPLTVFSTEQIRALIEMQTGDVYSRDKLRNSIRIVSESYGVLGYLDVGVRPSEIRRSEEPVVDLQLVVDEGQPYTVGLIRVIGNFLTRQKVILREMRLRTGRPFDSTQIARSERNLQASRLFNDVRIAIQEPHVFDASIRDVLVEIKERKTSSVNFGVAVGSDSGLFGELSIRQDNFDIADVPETLEEFLGGRAFRGAGQRFSLTLRPGDEIFQFIGSLTEPHFFDTDYSGTGTIAFRERDFDGYDEQRLSGEFGLGKRFGDIWTANLSFTGEEIELNDIEEDAPTEIFLDAGPNTITGVRLQLIRSTITTITRPGKGSRLELSFERAGALGGDFNYNKVEGDYTVFVTVGEDFLGRKTTLRLNTSVGYIFGSDRPPTYEQFYLGGRTLRGFDFRTISPKGIRNNDGLASDDPVGGEWSFFVGAQYEVPIFEEAFTGVLFVDSGTVTDSVGFDDYRAAIGAGIRLYVPQLGPVPIAFDFAIPVASQDTDEEQVFSFSAELPF
ncbi:MAG: outer membrane protein assembly factor BamA [Planctomycetota bacterium]